MSTNDLNEIIAFSYFFSPILILLISSILVAILGLLRRYNVAKLLSYLSIMSSIAVSAYFISLNYSMNFFNGLLALDRFSIISWIAILLGGIICIPAMSEEIYRKEALPLLLVSLTSALLAISSRDLILLFIAIEGSVFPAYVLVAQFKRDYFSLEATVKFFIFGIISTLLFAYGLAILFAISGSTRFADIELFIRTNLSTDVLPLLILGLILLISSLAIKSTLVPLHVWAIDTYQGSPSSIAAFLSSSSKILGIAAIALLLSAPFNNIYSYIPLLRYVVFLIAFATLILPNLAALVQKNIKRLLAYSSVAHAGYMSLVFVFPKETFPILGYYLIVYSIAKALSFLVVSKLTGEGSESPYDSLRGFFRSDPLTATAFTVSLLSLAGIPPFAGFMAKFLLFLATAFSGQLGVYLALTALIMSGVSVYYYAYLIRLEIYEDPIAKPKRNLDSDLAMIISIILLVILTFFPSYFYFETPVF